MTLVLVYLESCFGAYWNNNPNNNNGPRRPSQHMGRDRPRPGPGGQRHHRHIQPHHHGYPRLPNRMHNRPPPPGHRRVSRPPPPQFRHNFPHNEQSPHHNQNNNQGAMLIQPMMHNNPIPHQHHHHHHPQRQDLGVPPPFFQQDEIIQEQSKHFPVTAMANPNNLHAPNFQSVKDSQPHGYLSSTYKGWKPIVKPYQNSYIMTPGSTNLVTQQSSTYGMLPQNNGKNIMYSSHPTQTLNLDTLFREQTEHMKPHYHSLKQAFSENQGVRVPPPTVPMIKAVEIPIWNKRLPPPPSQSPVGANRQQPPQQDEGIKKPFNRPKIPQKVQQQSDNGNNGPSSSEDAPKFPKFKLRQRPQRPSAGGQVNKDATQESQNDQGISVLPPFPGKHATSSPSGDSTQQDQPLNLKTKLINRGRVRVRPKPKPESTTQSDEESSSPPSKLGGQRFGNHNHNHQNSISNSEPSTTENSPPRRNPQFFGRPQQQQPTSQTESSGEEDGGSPVHNFNRPQRPTSERSPPSSSPPPNRGHHRNHQHHTEEQRIRRPIERTPVSNSFSDGPSESGETEPEGQQQQQLLRGRRKQRPDTKNKIDDHTTDQPGVAGLPPSSYPSENPPQRFSGDDDSYFPPGFHTDPSKNTGQHPVSFMTMPGGKPQVIHHTYPPSHHSSHPQYPINVMRSPAPPDFHRGGESHPGSGSSPHGNYVSNNRPHFGAINVQNGPGHQQPPNNNGPNKPLRFPPPHHQHNSGPVFTSSNSNHEPSYFPAFGPNSQHSPQHNNFEGRFPPSSPPPHVHRHGPPPPSMSHPPPLSQAAQHSPPPMRLPPPTSTSTMRYPRYHSSSSAPPSSVGFPPSSPSSPSSGSSSYTSVEMRDSSEDPLSSTTPGAPFRHNNPERSNANPFAFPEYAPAYAGSSVEYDKIPMQFMDQLRPILRDDHPSSHTNQQTIQSHKSPDIHPPESFFDEFFQPFDQSFNPNPEQELDSKPTVQIETHVVQPQFINNFNAYEGYNAEQSSPQPHFARPISSNNKHNSAISSYLPPFIPTSESSLVSNDNDFIQPLDSSPVWSKLHNNDNNDLVSSSTEQQQIVVTPAAPTLKKHHHESKPTHKQQYQQYHVSTTAKTSNAKISKDAYNAETIPPVTTYKPSRFEKHDDDDDEEDSGFGLKKYLTAITTTTTARDQGDHVDSNTPKSVRFPIRDAQPSPSTTESSPETSTAYKSRRHFRRRRPDAAVRRRFFSSRVKSAGDEQDQQEQDHQQSSSPKSISSLFGGRSTTKATSTTPTTTTVDQKHINGPPSDQHHDDNAGYEPTRGSPLKQRRILQRRKSLASSTPTAEKGSSHDTTTPSKTPAAARPTSSSAESETVTYGESQWFRIKPTDSSELEAAAAAAFNSNKADGGSKSSSSTRGLKTGNKEVVGGGGRGTSGIAIPQFLPLEQPSSEISSSTETAASGVKTSYSSKHSVSYVEGAKYPVHKKATSSSSS